MHLRTLAIVTSLGFFVAHPAVAQQLTRPHLDWRTVETEHFVIHYTREHEAWTLHMAERLESVRTAVGELVGYVPPRKVTVLVDDPVNVANGFALPLIDAPVMYFFPTPPAPTWSIGSYREWSELLAVHEYAHLAHLTRPSRNPFERRVMALLPFRLGPISRRAPPWVSEGYATLIEGRLTGSGRPHGVWRPAVLRQWALEGRLPSYAELGATGGFRGGEMRYLVGSAFLEWLVARQGDSSLVHLWRRMTARQQRSFGEAFAGVYGVLPDELYGRFSAELTAQAVAIERAIGSAGGEDGELVQRLTWETGAPSVSPDGEHMALVVDSRLRPSRLVVMETRPDTALARRVREADERLIRRDPEDVVAVRPHPLPPKVIATLHPVGGRAHAEPRFLSDGRRILVVRAEPLEDGGLRRDVYVWDYREGSLRRVTRGAGIVRADPAPNGRTAVAERCRGGWCDVVIVDLETGAVRPLLSGDPRRSYYRPRFSPDGARIAAAQHANGRWRTVVVSAVGGDAQPVDPDDGANRYDPVFLDDRVLIVVSEQSGVPNLAMLRLDGSTPMEVALTNVTGAALAPEPARGDIVYFLRLHARGFDLRRASSGRALELVEQPPLPASAALARARAAVDSFARRPVSAPRAYGLGPRGWRMLPGVHTDGNSRGAMLSVGNFDPVGRLTLLGQGAVGSAAAWRGVSLRLAHRRHRIGMRGELFGAGDRPSRQDQRELAPADLDADFFGGLLAVDWHRIVGSSEMRATAGMHAMRVDFRDGEDPTRTVGFMELGYSTRQTAGTMWSAQGLALHGTLGRTRGADWGRARLRGSACAGVLSWGACGSAEYGLVGRGAPAFERLLLGGRTAPLFDEAVLSQRIAMPAFPLGVVSGRQAMTLRAAIVGATFEPYFWMGSAGERIDEWLRLVGIESRELAAPIPFARIPEIRAVTGVAYVLDEPLRHRWRGYASLVLRP